MGNPVMSIILDENFHKIWERKRNLKEKINHKDAENIEKKLR